MLTCEQSLQLTTRRHFFQHCGIGLGQIALASLLHSSGSQYASAAGGARSPYPPKASHFHPKVKRVIYLFMAGAPSQLDLFDHKPLLAKFAGKPIPPEVIAGQRYAFIQPDAAVLGPQYPFAKHGESGAEISAALPHLAKVADDIAIVKSVSTDQFNHAPAQLLLNTGFGIPGRPSIGSWLSYGIGSEANDLPSFVVLSSGGGISGGQALWSSGFLPSVHQGVPFRGQGDPILHVANPPGIDGVAQRETLDLVAQLNRRRFDIVGDPEIATRIDAYEMAYRMQARAPELMDFSQESANTLAMYGADPENPKKAFANQCLLARRLAERGVRFIQLYNHGWDHHSQVRNGLAAKCLETDQACAALIADLKRMGMLDETLVVWGGEFGRTPMVEGSVALQRALGRDHHPQAFSMWMAGGGIRAGNTIGATDEFGFNIVADKYHVHDVQATILHLMGIDHEQLSVRRGGLNFRLTGVDEHHPMQKVLA